MIAGSPLFKNLGMASGLDGLDEATGGGKPKPKAATQAPLPAPGTKVVLPGFEDMPLYAPEDTNKVKIQDTRTINPATGQPFAKGRQGAMTTSINPNNAKFVIQHALSKGVDPNTALAIALQETKMGNLNEDMGTANEYMADQGIDNPYEQGANALVKALADKLAYAKRLGFDKKGEAFALQAYNGYGRLTPQNTDPNATETFYGIPVTHQRPLDMKQNPVYGKTIMSLRDEVIKKNPELQELIQKAMQARQATPMQSPALAYTPQ